MEVMLTVTLCFTAWLSTVATDNLDDLKIIDSLLRNYDRRATPSNTFGEKKNRLTRFFNYLAGQPTEVSAEVFIRSFGSISEKTMVRLIFCTGT